MHALVLRVITPERPINVATCPVQPDHRSIPGCESRKGILTTTRRYSGNNKNAGSAGDARTPSLEVPRRPVARLRPHQLPHHCAGASCYPRWTLEIVLRSQSSMRSRVRGGGADTADEIDEKTMTDTEGLTWMVPSDDCILYVVSFTKAK